MIHDAFSRICTRIVCVVIFAVAGTSLFMAETADDNLFQNVNLFIGTGGDYGQLSPGATVPFGMIQICPDSNPRQHPGYDFEVPVISGFSINRLSGVGGSGCGGNVSLLPHMADEEVALLKPTEEAVPGYYAVTLSNGVKVCATASTHMAVEQFTFPMSDGARLRLNPASSFDKVFEADFKAIDAMTAEGMVISRNTCGRGRYHLHYRLFANVPFCVEEVDNGLKELCFDTLPEGRVEVRIVVSTGLADALNGMAADAVWKESFSTIRQQAAEAWHDVLSTISIKGGTAEEQTLFYTSLYRVFHSPFQVTDSDFPTFLGTDGQPHETDFTYYSSWSLWDTYRTKFPLITLLQPERSSDIMQSLAMLYVTGKKDWSTDYECVPTVRTEHAIATLLDAYRQGIAIPNLRDAYPGMVAEVKHLPMKQPDQCLETASDYWALGELAGELGYHSEALQWKARGEEIFDSIWPIHFMTIDSTFTKMRGNGLYQGTRWQYRWGAPMYLDRMIERVGKRQLAAELTEFFARELYNQGNEPDIHVPFLFGRLGMPRQTGDVVRRLSREEATHRYGGNDAYPTPFVGRAFTVAPRGYCPEMDEDDGAMSAWYVFAAIGLYPTVVGNAEYDLFSPLFDETTVRLAEGKALTISTRNRTSCTQQVKKITWNGHKVKSYRIRHRQLKKGGKLVFWY